MGPMLTLIFAPHDVDADDEDDPNDDSEVDFAAADDYDDPNR